MRNRALSQRLDSLDGELKSLAQGYIAPDHMTELLRALLAEQHGLKLVSLANLPVESLSRSAGAKPDEPIAPDDHGPFLHPVEMVVEGDYASVLAYLRSLEASALADSMAPARTDHRRLSVQPGSAGHRRAQPVARLDQRMNTACAMLACALTAAAAASSAAADELRDPTRPPMREARGAEVVREAAPVLSAVMTFNGKRTAIFNGRLVREGSVVGPYTIASVLEDGVRYRRSNETHELHLAHHIHSQEARGRPGAGAERRATMNYLRVLLGSPDAVQLGHRARVVRMSPASTSR